MILKSQKSDFIQLNWFNPYHRARLAGVLVKAADQHGTHVGWRCLCRVCILLEIQMALRCTIVFRLTLGLMGLDKLHFWVLTMSLGIWKRGTMHRKVCCVTCLLEHDVVNWFGHRFETYEKGQHWVLVVHLPLLCLGLCYWDFQGFIVMQHHIQTFYKWWTKLVLTRSLRLSMKFCLYSWIVWCSFNNQTPQPKMKIYVHYASIRGWIGGATIAFETAACFCHAPNDPRSHTFNNPNTRVLSSLSTPCSHWIYNDSLWHVQIWGNNVCAYHEGSADGCKGTIELRVPIQAKGSMVWWLKCMLSFLLFVFCDWPSMARY